MRFPKRIRVRGRVLATIYSKSRHYGYRLSWRTNGQRRMQRFKSYAQAKLAADTLVRDLAKGGQVAALSPAQARDALAALQHLDAFRRQSGRALSLLECVSQLTEATSKLRGKPLSEAIDGYLSTVAQVKRVDVSAAVEEFLHNEKGRTKPDASGLRQLSEKWHYNLVIILRRFASTFPNTAVSDLGKAHMDAFMGSLAEFSPKSRKNYRATVRAFLEWCIAKDYLSPLNKLAYSVEMRRKLDTSVAEAAYRGTG